jgi:hypothetical protein
VSLFVLRPEIEEEEEGNIFHFPPPTGGQAAETSQSLFSHTVGKIRDRYGEDG